MSRLRLRGGTTVEGTAPPPDYGPTLGKSWVINNVGPRFVSKPAGAISISPPGGLTQAVLDAAASNAVFWLEPGTHTSIRGSWDMGLLPKSGQTIAAPSDGSCIIDGGGWASGVGWGAASGNGPTNVTIRGGQWQNYGWVGAYAWHSPFHLGPGWTVEDCTVTNNQQSGTHKGGFPNLHGVTVRYNSFTNNGRYGSVFFGVSTADPTRDVTFEHNYLYNNNTAHYDTADDAGGSKWGYMGSGGLWRYNYFLNNYGFDCWFDTGVMDVRVEENVLVKARLGTGEWWAPFHWEDCGPGWFTRNYVELQGSITMGDTSSGGVRVVSTDGQRYSNSLKKEYEVSYNIIYSDQNIWSWCLWSQADANGYPRHSPRSVWFHHNDVYQPTTIAGRVGGGVTSSTMLPQYQDWYTGRDIQYYMNRYHVGNTAAANWAYGYPGIGVNNTWSQWQALGYDTTGSNTTYTGPPS